MEEQYEFNGKTFSNKQDFDNYVWESLRVVNLRNTLAEYIVKELQEEFKTYHLSENLVNSISVSYSEKGAIIEIAAPTYNLTRFFDDGVIVHDGKGSYASQLDKKGSIFGHHKHYVNNCIDRAIVRLKANKDLKTKGE